MHLLLGTIYYQSKPVNNQQLEQLKSSGKGKVLYVFSDNEKDNKRGAGTSRVHDVQLLKAAFVDKKGNDVYYDRKDGGNVAYGIVTSLQSATSFDSFRQEEFEHIKEKLKEGYTIIIPAIREQISPVILHGLDGNPSMPLIHFILQII